MVLDFHVEDGRFASQVLTYIRDKLKRIRGVKGTPFRWRRELGRWDRHRSSYCYAKDLANFSALEVSLIVARMRNEAIPAVGSDTASRVLQN